MNKRSRRFAALLAATIMVFGSTMGVSAANTQDTSFRFETNVSDNAITPRPKYDSTSVYVKVDTYKPSAQIAVQSCPTDKGPWNNCIKNHITVTASSGQASSIYVTVSSGYVRLYGRSVSASSSAGVWSPDSTRDYKVLN